jgi:hypothetical protein
MAVFRFRLQRVLGWQERVCRMEDERLRQRFAELAATQERLAQLALSSARVERDLLAQRQMAAADLAALAEFRKHAASMRQALARERVERGKAIAAQQEKVRAERRKLKVLEKLRERAWSEHTREEERQLETLGLETHLAMLIRQRSQLPPE